jgi:hypothetical protein
MAVIDKERSARRRAGQIPSLARHARLVPRLLPDTLSIGCPSGPKMRIIG